MNKKLSYERERYIKAARMYFESLGVTPTNEQIEHFVNVICNDDDKPSVATKYDKPCNKPCPKCGSMDINMVYRIGGETWHVFNGRYHCHKNEFVKEHGRSGQALKECITCTCRSCKYRFDIPPISG